MSAVDEDWKKGPLAWMVFNRVTPNLLMIFLLLGGLMMSSKITKEVFPPFDLDIVRINIAYPGSSPEEVEQGIILAVEEGIHGIVGVKKVTATAGEGYARINAELLADVDRQNVLQEIKQEVDRITTFPDDAEEPMVSLVSHRRQVLKINLYGNVSEHDLREVAEQTRDRLLQDKYITQVDIVGGRDHEILVEIPLMNLRAYGLTLAEVAGIISRSSVEIPGGKLNTESGEILLRIKNRRDWADEFSRMPIITTPQGAVVFLEDIGEVSDVFEETKRIATFNGKPSIQVSVFRVGQQTPVEISKTARSVMSEIEVDLPPGISWAINSDRSIIYQQRLELLLKNASIGLVLVLLLLGLFLNFKLAFWVTMGIPISFFGGLLVLPSLDVSINMISMFAFIVSLGIVVDDAIIAGENIYEYRQRGMDYIKAAVQGARDVAVPISFSILTNIVAFMPLYFVPGVMGKIWRVIPVVVVTVFIISWLESLLILPAHLAHTKNGTGNPLSAFLTRWQHKFAAQVVHFIKSVYGPILSLSLNNRWLTIALSLSLLMVTLGYVKSGRIGMILMPRVESDRAVVTATLPYGSSLGKVEEVRNRLTEAMERVAAAHGGPLLLDGIFALVNENEVEISAYLTPPDERPLTTRDVTIFWRKETGPIPGLQSLKFESDRGGPGRGASISVELTHRNVKILDRASQELATRLGEFPNVKDVDDGYTPGKEQLDFIITMEGESLGLTASEVARQVRNGFQGIIALRQQRGRDEVTVRVRFPESERISEGDIESMMIATPRGGFVPLFQVAQVDRGRAYTSISRRDGRRTVRITGNVEPIGQTSRILTNMNDYILPDLTRDYPGLDYSYEGRLADRKESMKSLLTNFYLSLLLIYFILAIPFKSYIQPIIIMLAIPFGMIGAVGGHIIMGYNLSLMSMMGMVALSGVVVNDSLVLIDYSNKQRRKGATPFDAILAAGQRRFRPIILTTFTTFGGLAPMIFETSRQARFLIPMGLALGFGILFATVINLLIVPSFYLIIEDVRILFSWGKKKEKLKQQLTPVNGKKAGLSALVVTLSFLFENTLQISCFL